jgi:hypothetical protein
MGDEAGALKEMEKVARRSAAAWAFSGFQDFRKKKIINPKLKR